MGLEVGLRPRVPQCGRGEGEGAPRTFSSKDSEKAQNDFCLPTVRARLLLETARVKQAGELGEGREGKRAGAQEPFLPEG